eukprot:TRINITY_DN7497_c0_g1_i1.p1 TRINITY_DN7497_c0_g1~~TRINITY_DN7497_c0_g1_i1.p1  ORF type:complete len:77 (+),score=5.10 TRINITY_DN7497_c0_g1_i1:146-376(+)
MFSLCTNAVFALFILLIAPGLSTLISSQRATPSFKPSWKSSHALPETAFTHSKTAFSRPSSRFDAFLLQDQHQAPV